LQEQNSNYYQKANDIGKDFFLCYLSGFSCAGRASALPASAAERSDRTLAKSHKSKNYRGFY
jgi:hypothetical protein